MRRKERKMTTPSSLIHWRPLGDFTDLHRRIDHLFEELTDGEGSKLAAVDVIREEDRIVVRADMPGIKPEDLKIEVADDMLTIHGEHQESKEGKDKRYVRRERSYHSFTRSLVLPPGVDPEKIEATCKDGVVEVTVPLPAKEEPRVIQVTPKA
jgi:HSP20 family protein